MSSAAPAAPAAPAAGPSAPGPYQPRGRWAEQSDPQAIRSLLETRSLQLALSPSPQRLDGEHRVDGEEEEADSHFHPQSLDSLMDEEEEERMEEEEVEEEEDEKVGQRADVTVCEYA